jgi:hypothetical protein
MPAALSGQRAWLAELRRLEPWPAYVPAVVLAEVLTGDHRRDFETTKLLRLCVIPPVEEPLAGVAGWLRTLTGRGPSPRLTLWWRRSPPSGRGRRS